MSRNIKLPSRVQLRNIDSATGSYPTISRIGDSRTGRYNVKFDDTKTLLFNTETSLSYPTLLPSGSEFIGIQSSSIYATGTVRKGIADQFAFFDRGAQELLPFNDSLYVEQGGRNESAEFYQTGSRLADVGFGFTSPLKSKTAFQIDVSASVNTTLKLSSSTGLTGGDTDGVGSYPMAYYNFVEKTWEPVGLGVSFDDSASGNHNYATQMLGFSPSSLNGSDVILNPSQSCIPFDQFGFPVHPKFHATSSQVLHMSGLIDRPFVLEKIVIECSASYSGTTVFVPESEGSWNTFFVLNQRGPANLHLTFDDQIFNQAQTITASLPASLQLSRGASPVEVNDLRDIVSWLQVSSFTDIVNSSSADFKNFAERELTIFGSAISTSWSGSIELSGTAKVPAVSSYHSYFADPSAEESPVLYRFGGRGNVGRASGRDLVSGFVSNPNVATFADPLGTVAVKARQMSGTSPYVLFPEDKLVFGWQAPWVADMDAVDNDDRPRLTLNAGPGRITLYGSMVREGKEFHDTLNQPLTSLAVHESLQSGIPVFDQFDVEFHEAMSGSYLGNFVTGTMAVGSATRGIAASTVVSSGVFDDAVGTPDHELSVSKVSGFSRAVKLVSDNERFFDTLLPKPSDITKANGANITRTESAIFGGPYGQIYLGQLTGFGDVVSDDDWNRAYPFETRYAGLDRVLNPARHSITTVTSSGPSSTDPDTVDDLVIVRVIDGVGYTEVSPQFLSLIPGGLATGNDFLRSYFGISTDLLTSGSGGTYFTRTAIPQARFGPKIRGFKYGIFNCLPHFSSMYFRRNRYGQFRDMLEQRLDAKWFDTLGLNPDGSSTGKAGPTRAPVQVRFMSRSLDTDGFEKLIPVDASKTISSNMSPEATSSLPYFDGMARN